MMEEIPVYLFTGFLDAGKTKFIQETLEDVRFNNGESTLLLLCEEGEEEYEDVYKRQEYDREKLQERLARLAGGVAVIRVGAATETEMKEKKLRIEDALNATRAAVEEGIVAGGGTAYVNAIPEIEKLVDSVEGDEKTGVQIIARALTAPLRQIDTNAGLDASVDVYKRQHLHKNTDPRGNDSSRVYFTLRFRF